MQKRIFAVLLIFIFLFAQFGDVYARSRSGGIKSSRSSSSRSTKYFGSSSSKKSSTSKSYSGSSSKSGTSKSGSGSSKTGSSGSGSSSSGKSYSGSSKSASSNSDSVSNSSSSTSKNKYMEDAYKKQVSENNYNAYKAKLNSEQQKVYNSSMNRNYNVNNRMSFESAIRTKSQRINAYAKRPIYVNVNTGYFSSPFSYGYASVGPWDLWFLLRASELFWYHHWNDIYAYRNYFDASQFANMEARVKALEAQNIVRDANYLEPGADLDLQFSSDYQQKHTGSIYYTNKHPSRAGNVNVTLVILLIIVVILVSIIKKVSRPKRSYGSNSSIY